MNGLERMLAAARFQPTDRVPFAPQLFGHAATAAGVGLGAYLRDGRLLAECQLRERERCGGDAVFSFMDFGVEPEALGARLKYYDQQYPDVVGSLLGAADDPARLRPPDPACDGRMPEVLRAIALLRGAVGDTAYVAGTVAGPMTLASQLYGTEAALYLAADDPQRYEAALDLAAGVALRFGVAQLAAGAHGIIVFDPAASPAVVPAAFFRELLKPRLTGLITGLRAAGATLTWLNIAGPTADILPHYAEIGADIATFDYYVTPADARCQLPHTCLAGNLKSLDFLDRAPATIAAQTRHLVDAFTDRGGYILSSGCEIPPEADPANLAALAAAAGAASAK
jgi:uroporphyrinogen decarboxylase